MDGSARRTALLVPASDAVPAAFTALTAREREVLGHLVANRTIAEIGQALFISEKTVCVHVSNLAAQDRDPVTPRGRRAGSPRGVVVSRPDTEWSGEGLGLQGVVLGLVDGA